MRKMVVSGRPGVFWPGTIEIASTQSGLACGFELAEEICRRSSQAFSTTLEFRAALFGSGLFNVAVKTSWARVDETAKRRRRNAASRESICGPRLPQVG